VMTEEEYNRAVRSAQPDKPDIGLLKREDWGRGLRNGDANDEDYNGNTDMVKYWSKLGFIVPIDPTAPDPVYVEEQRGKIPSLRGPILRAPITTVEKLRDHLNIALRIELSTIPLYLYAMYSIDASPDFDTPGTDDSKAKRGREVKSTIRSVVSEEMLHLGLVGNLLLAIGERPVLYDRLVIPNYPSPLFCRIPDLPLNLQPGTQEHIKTFVEIELPEDSKSPPEDDQYHTVGQFYKAIEKGFQTVDKTNKELFKNPQTGCQFSPTHREYSPKAPDAGGLVLIKDLKSALEAIEVIVVQGEGHIIGGSHDELSHYLRFKNLVDSPDSWRVYNVPTNPKAANYQDVKIVKLARVFNAAYCYLLMTIEKLWTVDDSKERQNILYGSMYEIMTGVMGPIGNFLSHQQLPGPQLDGENPEFAAPTFEYYEFTEDPKAEMSRKMQEVIDLYLDLGVNIRDTLQSIKTGIDNLYSYPPA